VAPFEIDWNSTPLAEAFDFIDEFMAVHKGHPE
jgi:hypothetical protein